MVPASAKRGDLPGPPRPAVAPHLQPRFMARMRPRLGPLGLLTAAAGLVIAAVVSAGPATGASRDAFQRLPVRGLHLGAPAKSELPAVLGFIREVLPAQGVNTLILEFGYHFDFKSRPEFANAGALGANEVRQIVGLCREKGIQLVPQINCLGHQSWARHNGRLLEQHPEFDETPGKYPDNQGIYCRSYCPLHPEVHRLLFDLIDELARACQATAFHVGQDEVFILADPDCPRCRGKDAAQLFAGEVKVLHAHLRRIGCRMWMWGDRLLDGKTTGLGKWEASVNGTQSAIDLVPKDILICDWHYDAAPDTPQLFARKGFDVVACPWRKSAVALAQLAHIRAIRDGADRKLARHALGMVQTTWCGFAPFVRAHTGQQSGAAGEKGAPSESADCFAKLFAGLRVKP